MSFKEENFKPRQRVNYEAVLHVTTPKKSGSWRLWVLLVVFLILLIGSVYLLFFSNYFKISEVVINGGKDEMKQEINQKLNWESKYMMLFDADAFRQTLLSRWDELAEVNVTKIWPNKLEIELVPEVPNLVWHSADKLFLINSAGVVLSRIEESDRLEKFGNLPVVDDMSGLFFEDGDKVVSRDFVMFMESVKQNIENSIKKDIQAFEVVETTFELRVKMKDGFYVYFDALRDPQTQVEKLSIFFKNNLMVDDYIDLRVPGKIYYK